MFWFKKEPYISQILLKLWLIGNRTPCRPIRSVIILVIKQIRLPLRGRPISLITRMITERIGLHTVLLPLLIPLMEVKLKPGTGLCSSSGGYGFLTHTYPHKSHASISDARTTLTCNKTSVLRKNGEYVERIKARSIQSIYSWFNKGCFKQWELGIGKLLLGGHSSKLLHCSICPNAQRTIDLFSLYALFSQ